MLNFRFCLPLSEILDVESEDLQLERYSMDSNAMSCFGQRLHVAQKPSSGYNNRYTYI